MKRKISYLIALAMFSALSFTSCKKLIEIDEPIERTTAKTVYSSTSMAVMALNGLYSKMPEVNSDDPMIARWGLLADELELGNFNFGKSYYLNDLQLENGSPTEWDRLYNFIFKVNSLIEGVRASNGIPEQTKSIFHGEAKFLRAYTYLNLVNLYGDVPLVTSTSAQENANIARSPVSEIYRFIILDLKDAQSLLKDNYLGPDLYTSSPERISANKAVVTALLARAYLYLRDYSNAEIEATKLIQNSNYELEENLNKVFLKNSKEAIFQLQPDATLADAADTELGRFFIPRDGEALKVYLTNDLLSLFSTSDNRGAAWTNEVSTDILIPFKYKRGYRSDTDPQPEQTEYVMVLRLAEQYLIRAEARAYSNDYDGAEKDLNRIRLRAGLDEFHSGDDEGKLVDAIFEERQRELFAEGHRWFDLKRSGRIDAVMQNVAVKKGTTWASYKHLFPIPLTEFLTNRSLVGHQNPGYREF